MRRKSKKPKSLKFYLCLMGILAGIYLVLVAVLAIRNPVENKTETASSSVSTEVRAPKSKVENLLPTPSEPAKADEEQSAASAEETEDVQEQDEEPQKQKTEEVDAYGRGKERYTTFDAQDIFTKVNVKIPNEMDLRAVTGASYDTVRSYLNIYASRNNIEATKCRMMAHMYIGQLGDRIEIYMRFNDEAKTLVTVIFEPANSTHSSHVDVVPCQYTAMEIKKLKRDGHL